MKGLHSAVGKVLIAVVMFAVFALPATSFAAVDKKQEFLSYLDKLDALAKYESTALASYQKNNVVTSKNRKVVYASFNYTIVPNYSKLVYGLKQIKPVSEELATIHSYYVNGSTITLSALTAMKNAVGKNPVDMKAFGKANTQIGAGKKLIDKWTVEITKYAKKASSVVNNNNTNTNNSSTSNTTIYLPLDFKEAKATKDLASVALRIFKAYGVALKSDSNKEFDTLIRGLIEDRTFGNQLSADDYSLELLNNKIEYDLKNSDADLLAQWVGIVSKTTVDDLYTLDSAESGQDNAHFSFKLPLGEYDLFLAPIVNIDFVKYGGKYVIGSITIS
jgi:hypothetical protein